MGSAKRAQHIHDAMVQMYRDTSDPLLAPSVVSYNALINAWGKCNAKDSLILDAPKQAENVLQEMLDAMNSKDNSNPISENNSNTHVITNISNSEVVNDTKEMDCNDDKDCYDESIVSLSWNEIKPDAITFSTLIDTYAKQYSSKQQRIPPSSVLRCEELFDMMDALSIKKNAYTYSALQNVYARSGTKDAPDKALAVLDQMLVAYYKNGDIFAKPNAINYNGTWKNSD